jgi:hypothetical protein
MDWVKGAEPEPYPAAALEWYVCDHPMKVLQIICGGCRNTSDYGLRLLCMRGYGALKLRQVIEKLTCNGCRKSPASIVLFETHIRNSHGVCAGWTVELFSATLER